MTENIPALVARALTSGQNDPQTAIIIELCEALSRTTARGEASAADWCNDDRTATLYQVIGALASHAGVSADDAIIRALDLAAYGKTTDGNDVLPFVLSTPPVATMLLGVEERDSLPERAFEAMARSDADFDGYAWEGMSVQYESDMWNGVGGPTQPLCGQFLHRYDALELLPHCARVLFTIAAYFAPLCLQVP